MTVPNETAPPVVAPVTRHIEQSRVDLYARAARDPNPLHSDAEYAAATPFGRPIAHGMLVLAFVSEMMAAAFGERWEGGGMLDVRWRSPAMPPVTVTARASLRGVKDGVATYDVTCEDAAGTQLLSGTASARYVDTTA
jgi:3-hydroxybutyryl-CoA dehydratase